MKFPLNKGGKGRRPWGFSWWVARRMRHFLRSFGEIAVPWGYDEI